MTRTEMISRLCDMISELEMMKQLPFVGQIDQVELSEIETRIHHFLEHLQSSDCGWKGGWQ